MESAIAAVAILIAALSTYWRPLRRLRTALGFGHMVSTGHAFVVLGFLLGLVFGDHEAFSVNDLEPLVAFFAGWVGFATGMRFNRRVLRTIPLRAFAAALFPALAAALIVGATGGAILYFGGASRSQALAAALVLGAAAASSGPTLVAALRGRKAGRSSEARPLLRMIEFSAGVDDIIVILLSVLAFGLFRPGTEPAPFVFLVSALVGGALLGAVTWLFLGGRATDDERLLLGLAMLAFTAGFAGWLELSPAGVAAVSAIVLVNLPGDRMQLLSNAVRRVERPVVVVMMTMIGFHSAGHFDWILVPLVGAMTLLRLLAKHLAGELVAGAMPGPGGLRTHKRWGTALTPQGILGLVVTLGFFFSFRDDVARTVLSAVALSGLLNELCAPWFLLRLLRGIPLSRPVASVPPAGSTS